MRPSCIIQTELCHHPAHRLQSAVLTPDTSNTISMPFIAFSEDVVPYWRCCFIRDWCLFISSSFKTLHISWAAADLQTLEFFNLCVCSIYCFGVFPSPSSPDAFTGSEVSTALSLMDCLSPTEFKAGSDTGEPGVFWLAQFVLIPPFLSNFGGVCRPD